MRILFAGAFDFPIYEQACVDALSVLGHEVIRFSWRKYFRSLPGRVEEKYVVSGINTLRLNRELRKRTNELNPDVLFVWRGTHIWPQTLRWIKKEANAFIVSYNNDDPFSPYYIKSNSLHRRRLWRLYHKTLLEYDLHFVYRPVNIDDFRRAGVKKICLLPPYFVPDRDRPIKLSPEEKKIYECEVVFVGHYEGDKRLKYLQALVNAGFKVKLFGTGWNKKVLGESYNYFGPVRPVRDDEYTKALCGAKICLAFFSKLNRDTYTRRTFEIPSTGSVMLSEYSEDAASFFCEGKEAMFFGSEAELLQKVHFLIDREDRRKEIADAALRRSYSSGYDVLSRMKLCIEHINNGRS